MTGISEVRQKLHCLAGSPPLSQDLPVACHGMWLITVMEVRVKLCDDYDTVEREQGFFETYLILN
jgi:hypothetical protein